MAKLFCNYFPDLPAAGMNLFVGQFDYMMTTVLVMAAPVMVVMLVIDLSFGLVNRYAPQLNVFALTLPLKAWAATGIILLLLGVYVEILLRRLHDSEALVLYTIGMLTESMRNRASSRRK